MTTYTLTTGPDTVDGGSSGDNTVLATDGTLSAGDMIDAGTGGNNTLELSGAGMFDLTLPATLLDIQSVVVDSSGATITLRPGLPVAVTLASAGDDTITLANAGDTVNVNGGENDNIYVPVALINDVTLNGGDFNILWIQGAVDQTVTLGANISNFAYVHIDQNGNTLDTGNLPNALVYVDNTFSATAAPDTIILRGSGQTVIDYTGGNTIDFAGGSETLDLPYAGPTPQGIETLENFDNTDQVTLDALVDPSTVTLDPTTDILTITDTDDDTQQFQLFGTYDPSAFVVTNNGGTTPETLTYTGTVTGITYTLTTGVDTIAAGATGGNTIIAATNTLSAGDMIDAGTGGNNVLLLQGAGTFDLTQPTTLTDIAAVDAADANETITLRAGLPVTVTVSSSGSDVITLANAGDVVSGGTSGANVFYVPIAIASGVTIDPGDGSGSDLYFTGTSATGALSTNITDTGSSIAHVDQSGDTLDLRAVSFEFVDIDPGTGAADNVTVGTIESVQDATDGNTITLNGEDIVDLSTAGQGAVPTIQAADTLLNFDGTDTIELAQFVGNQAVSFDSTTNTLTVTGTNAFDAPVTATIKLNPSLYYVGTFSTTTVSGQPAQITFSGTVSTTPPPPPVSPVYWTQLYGTLVSSDGTLSGTSAVEPYTATIGSTGYQTQTVINGKLYAYSNVAGLATVLTASDGTTAGTTVIADFAAQGTTGQPTPNVEILPNTLGALGSGAAFLTNEVVGRTVTATGGSTLSDTVTLWSTDGTASGTRALATFTSSEGGQASFDGSAGGLYYFQAATGATADFQLYVTNGSTVTALQDFGAQQATQFATISGGGLLYGLGGALYRSDGTAATTRLLFGAQSPGLGQNYLENLLGSYNEDAIVAYGNYGSGSTVYLGLVDAGGNLTALGTLPNSVSNGGGSALQIDASHFAVDDLGTMFGSANGGAIAAITYTGLPTGASVYAPGLTAGNSAVMGGALYFFGNVSVSGSTYEALFRTDGVTATLVDNFNQQGSNAGQLTADSGTLFFTISINGSDELRRTDGSSASVQVGSPTNGLFEFPTNLVAGPLTPDSPEPSPQTFTLTTGDDTINGGSSQNTIIATGGTLNAGDVINAGSGAGNILRLQGQGSFDLSQPTTLTGIAEVDAEVGGISGSTQTITLRSGMDAVVHIVAPSNPEKIVGANDSDVIIGQGGENFSGQYVTEVDVGSAQETIDVNQANVVTSAAVAGALIESPHTLTINGGGAAVLNANDQLSGTTITLSLATNLSVGGSGSFTIGGNMTVDLTQAGNTIALGGNGLFTINAAGQDTIVEQATGSYDVVGTSQILNGATIDGFGVNGTQLNELGLPVHAIDFTNISNANVNIQYTGTQLTVSDGTHSATLTVPITNENSVFFVHNVDPSGTGTILSYEMTCFVTGTLISTPAGEVPVEHLVAGDTVYTASGDQRIVRWVGRRRIDPSAHPHKAAVLPVRIRAGALGDFVPRRDVFVSPDHALFIDGMLIPARLLLNGGSIAMADRNKPFIYWHVELDEHDVLLAEGLPVESYLDTGNRDVFDNAGLPVVLHPDLARIDRDFTGCAPFVTDPARIAPIWRRIAGADATQSAAPPMTDAAEIWLSVDGHVLRPIARSDRCIAFALPRGATEAHLISPSHRPSDTCPWVDDRRDLGVAVERIEADGELVPLDGPAAGRGWWGLEGQGGRRWRWTDGDAALTPPPGTALLTVTIAA